MITEAEKIKHPINKRANEWNKQLMEEEIKIPIKYFKRLQHI